MSAAQTRGRNKERTETMMISRSPLAMPPTVRNQPVNFGNSAPSQNVKPLTDTTFSQALQESSSIPVVVDFYADWCPPCQKLGPVLEQFAGEKQGSVKVYKINVDQNRKSSSDYGISSIPTLILFKNGQVVKKEMGFKDKKALAKFIGA